MAPEPKQQISARIDVELFIAAHDHREPLSNLVEEGLRRVLGMPRTNGFIDGLVDGPSREEFDGLAAEVGEIKKAMQEARVL